MSKIYEALRRHESSTKLQPPSSAARGPIVRALESVYPIVYRLAKEAGHGLVLHFVAASPGEGTSTLSSEFARVAARIADSRVLLIDGDRSRLTTATRFGCPVDSGIFDRFQAGRPVEEALVTEPDHPRLQVGALCANASAPLSRKSMPALYDQCRAQYDLSIVDCPAVFTDRYFELCPEATDGVILIVRAEGSRPEIVRQAQSLIENSGGHFIGAILNQRRTYIPQLLYRLL